MIRLNDQLQCLECDGCGDVVELSRWVIGEPETLAMMREQMGKDHRNCASYQGDTRAAKRSADFDRRMRAEFAKLPKAS